MIEATHVPQSSGSWMRSSSPDLKKPEMGSKVSRTRAPSALTHTLSSLQTFLEKSDIGIILEELVYSEFLYSENVLRVLNIEFEARMKIMENRDKTVIKREKLSTLFTGVTSLYSLHCSLCKDLTAACFSRDTIDLNLLYDPVITLLHDFYQYLKMYMAYITSYLGKSTAFKDTIESSEAFSKFSTIHDTIYGKQLGLESLLQAPLYRLPQYVLFVGQLHARIAHMVPHDQATRLKNTCLGLLDIVGSVQSHFRNKRQRDAVINVAAFFNEESIVVPSRIVVKEAWVHIVESSQKSPPKNVKIRLVLFNDSIALGTKATRRMLGGYAQFKRIVQLDAVSAREIVDYDTNRPKIALHFKDGEIIQLEVENDKDEMEWINAITTASMKDLVDARSGKPSVTSRRFLPFQGDSANEPVYNSETLTRIPGYNTIVGIPTELMDMPEDNKLPQVLEEEPEDSADEMIVSPSDLYYFMKKSARSYIEFMEDVLDGDFEGEAPLNVFGFK